MTQQNVVVRGRQADVEITTEMIEAGVEELRKKVGVGISCNNSSHTLGLIVVAVLTKALSAHNVALQLEPQRGLSTID